MKTYWGSGGIAPRILDLGTRWRGVVSFTLQPLYLQGKSPWYPLNRRLDEPQSRSGRGGEDKDFPATAGNRTVELRLSSPLLSAVPTKLSRLCYVLMSFIIFIFHLAVLLLWAIKWARHVFWMGEMRNICKILVGIPQGEN
jgi:hypothetical protein